MSDDIPYTLAERVDEHKRRSEFLFRAVWKDIERLRKQVAELEAMLAICQAQLGITAKKENPT